jgi:hypothetical protein
MSTFLDEKETGIFCNAQVLNGEEVMEYRFWRFMGRAARPTYSPSVTEKL